MCLCANAGRCLYVSSAEEAREEAGRSLRRQVSERSLGALPMSDAEDLINRPPHYASTEIECIDAITACVEGWPGESAFLAANVIKYVWRHRGKDPVSSLKKARWYLDRLIAAAERA